jgi:ferrous iron transport protein B
MNSSRALRRHLLDMGLIPGTMVKMLTPAPAGDPLAIHLRGFELSLRKEDAARIEVESVTPNAVSGFCETADCRACRRGRSL